MAPIPATLPDVSSSSSAAAPARGSDRRLLLVHAHPDDECIATGATMARYVDEGVHVTLVTCTLGEEGEVLLPELAHLASDKDDALGAHRQTELAAAMAELGVTDSQPAPRTSARSWPCSTNWARAGSW